ncbi:hypothetical protein AMTR_s00022p00228970 [Amborella trichopoda]|uniref:BHLH domain-containing protein n=1 Tax=Amborella trichopoda TaxID=13333 RepID=W1PV68_AMBTC|nr:hypothetical protein AMTR_s00022p00228970 [Amborella trichopoda]
MYGAAQTSPIGLKLNLCNNTKGSSLSQIKEDDRNRGPLMDFGAGTNPLQNTASSLMRYKSAPGSLFASLVQDCDDDFLPRSSSPESENVLARLLSCDSSCLTSESRDLQSHASPDVLEMETKPVCNSGQRLHGDRFVAENEPEVAQQRSGGFGASPHMVYQHQNPNGSLLRQSSSPAGFLSHLTGENGYSTLRTMGNNFRPGNCSNGLKGHMSFSRQQGNHAGMLPQISEIVSETVGPSSSDEGSLGNGSQGQCYIPGFPVGSWDDSTLVAESLSGFETAADFSAVRKRIRDLNGKSTSESQVRRTKISERMRRLQELVPNMDKQTNTADMLDLAVEYIKDLQKQVQNLSDSRANCTCSVKQQKPSYPI